MKDVCLARQYRQRRRKDAAEEMRERIVRATFDLHGEQGVLGTTMKQIAERAGVSVGSVYHHFPTYDDAINACGTYAFSRAPAPSPVLFDGAVDVAERVRRLARATFAVFDEIPGYGHVAAEVDRVPALRPFVDGELAGRLAMSALAIGRRESSEEARTLAAMLDVGVHKALKDMGFAAAEAADRAADLANAWLASREP